MWKYGGYFSPPSTASFFPSLPHSHSLFFCHSQAIFQISFVLLLFFKKKRGGGILALQHLFPNFPEYSLEDFLKPRLWVSSPKFLSPEVGGEAWEPTFLTSSYMMLGQEPHFDRSKESSWNKEKIFIFNTFNDTFSCFLKQSPAFLFCTGPHECCNQSWALLSGRVTTEVKNLGAVFTGTGICNKEDDSPGWDLFLALF